MRYFIELAYNGKNYFGWQIQLNVKSVQETIEYCLSKILKTPINVVGAGRTDTGVHAKQMFAHFDVENEVDTLNTQMRLNLFLPKDIFIYKIFRVEDKVHSRFDATSRTYEYHISLCKNPFINGLSYQVNSKKYDINAMNQACKILFEYEDFKCFSKSKTQVITNNCDVMQAFWEQRGNELIFTIQANRFLRNMVRAIVGTMLEIGLYKISVKDFRKIIEQKDRCNAGTSAPAQGLFLTKITYPQNIFEYEKI